MPPVSKPVIQPRLRTIPTTDQMKLADEAALVPAVRDQLCNEWRSLRRKRVVSVPRVVNPAGIHAGHETRAARRTDRALAVRMSKRDALSHKRIDRRRPNEFVAQSSDRVEPLLIGAVPENVRASHVRTEGRKAKDESDRESI